MTDKADITITNVTDKHRYEAVIGSALAGICEYNLLKGAIMFTHTEVMEAYEGKGVGSALARHVLDEARASGLQVIPVCQFIAGWIRKHPEYIDIVQPASRQAFKI